jgi:hypothetical protein
MTTNRTSRRAEDFDRALTAGGAAADPSMAALVVLAGALATVPQRATPAFRDALRTKLMAEAAHVLPAASVPAASVPAATPSGGLRHVMSKPALQLATGGLAATVAVTGVGVGASRSVPGDTLYGLKRTIERWQVGLAGDKTSEAGALLEHAQTRLDEVRTLLRRGDLSRVTSALAALDAELKSATARLLAAAADGSREAYDALRAALTDFETQLKALYDNLPAGARTEFATVFQTLNVATARLNAMPVPVPGSPSPTAPVVVPTTPVESPTAVVTTPPPPSGSVTVTVPPPPSGSVTVTVPPPPSGTVTVPPPTSILPSLPPVSIPPVGP